MDSLLMVIADMKNLEGDQTVLVDTDSAEHCCSVVLLIFLLCSDLSEILHHKIFDSGQKSVFHELSCFKFELIC